MSKMFSLVSRWLFVSRNGIKMQFLGVFGFKSSTLTVYCWSSWFVHQQRKTCSNLCVLCWLSHLSWLQGPKDIPPSFWPQKSYFLGHCSFTQLFHDLSLLHCIAFESVAFGRRGLQCWYINPGHPYTAIAFRDVREAQSYWAMDTLYRLYCAHGHPIQTVLCTWTPYTGCIVHMDTLYMLYYAHEHPIQAVLCKWTRPQDTCYTVHNTV